MKVTLNGEAFEYDGRKAPMSEALAIEDVYGKNYAAWQTDLEAGSARAFACLAWIIWRRDGRDIPFDDILSGTTDFDLIELLTSLNESAEAEAQAAAEADPTPAGLDPAGSATTAPGISGSSPITSGSSRGKSAGSKSRSLRP